MAIACFDRELRVQYVNPFAAHLYDSIPGEIIGKTPRELNLPEPMLSLIEHRLREIFQTGNCDIFEFEWTLLPETRHFEVHCVPEYDETGQIALLCTISYDITQRKQAE